MSPIVAIGKSAMTGTSDSQKPISHGDQRDEARADRVEKIEDFWRG